MDHEISRWPNWATVHRADRRHTPGVSLHQLAAADGKHNQTGREPVGVLQEGEHRYRFQQPVRGPAKGRCVLRQAAEGHTPGCPGRAGVHPRQQRVRIPNIRHSGDTQGYHTAAGDGAKPERAEGEGSADAVAVSADV